MKQKYAGCLEKQESCFINQIYVLNCHTNKSMYEKKQSQISVKVPGSGFAPVWVRWSMNVAEHHIGVRESREVSHVHRKH